MRFYKLVKYDLINGICHRWYHYAGGAVIALLFFGDFTIRILGYAGDAAGLPEGISVTDYLLYFFQGKEAFVKGQQGAFLFPAGWMLLFLYSAWLMLEYPLSNLTGHGIQVITRTGKRRAWWLAKCIWTAVGTMVYFSVIYLTLLLVCRIFGIDISFSYAKDISSNLLKLSFLQHPSKQDFLLLLVILPVLTAIALNLMQLCLGLFAKRIYGFAVAALVLLASAYYQSPLAVGNYAMVKRNILVMPWGVAAWQGILVNMGLIFCSVITGLWRVKNYDILIKE